jgi:hypothetical protein
MMDCDTTGVEPDIALIKYKRLVGGGYLKIVNQGVTAALKKLGYDAKQAEEIVAWIDEHETIEGAPGLKDEHLEVFDCAFKPANGTRSIHYNGHLKMMAAVQPFISGAISKTVNMPEHSTADEIAQVYIDGWKLGLKAIAVYRDNSKRSQPLNTKKEGGDAARPMRPPHRARGADGLQAAAPAPADERASITHKFNVGGHEGYLTIGLYEDGTPGEIFLRMAKEGSTISGLMDSFATAVSLALQYGVPLKDLVNKFSHLRFEPAGFTTNRDIPMAKSLVDYIFRYMATKFMSQTDKDQVGIINRQMTLSDAKVVSGEATESTEASLRSASSASAGPTTTDSAPTRSAEKVEDSASASQPAAQTEATGPRQATSSAASIPVGGETVSAKEETVANGLLDGLKIVAQGVEAKDRADRLAAGQAPVVFDTADSPACTDCGSIMVRNGSCYKCINCGATSGTGKTTLARGLGYPLATSLRSPMLYLEVNAHKLGSGALGKTQKQVDSLFSETIPAAIDDDYALIVIDEIEVLATSRAKLSLDANPIDVHRAVDAALVGIDRLARDHPKALIIATTNFATAIDDAFISRADLVMQVPVPDLEGRKNILRDSLEALSVIRRPIHVLEPAVIERIAVAADGIDGRQLRKVVASALARGTETVNDFALLTEDDLLAAVREVLAR